MAGFTTSDVEIPDFATTVSVFASFVYLWHTKSYTHIHKQGDSLARGPKLVYQQIFNEFVNQLTDDELTIGYYQQDGVTCHTSNARMREIESFFKTEFSQKTFGHPDLPI